MCKYSDGTGGDYANRTKWVAPEEAFIVVYAHWGHDIGTCAAKRASRWGANISQKPYAVAICGQQYACKAISRQPAAGCKNGYGLANIPIHALN